MDLSINAEVRCLGEVGGHISNIILNPVTETVTHIVVKSSKVPHKEYVVPVAEIDKSSVQCVDLLISKEELENQQSYIERRYIQYEIPSYVSGSYRMLPYVVPEKKIVLNEHEHIPPGELAVHRGAHVEAVDRRVGQVDEFLVDPESGHITHLILREGHLWHQKDVAIPLSMIDRIEEDVIHLKAKKSALDKLPKIPVHRKWEYEEV
jgi:sporulation protein YlmC with PRC-barrel domain